MKRSGVGGDRSNIRCSLSCEVCKDAPSKYKCPRCDLKTCSLGCVKHHKTKIGCSGVRDKTAYVPIKVYNDFNLLSDYRFLEEAGRTADGAARDDLKKHSFRPKHLGKLIYQARRCGITLKLLPYPSTRRKNNRTLYHNRSKEILWQVEWVFPQADGKFTERLKSGEVLKNAMAKFLHPTDSDPVVRHKLKCYVRQGMDEIKLFLKAENRPANDPRYYEMNLTETLVDNLKGKIIIEFPVIHVVLRDQWSRYPALIKEDDKVPAPVEESYMATHEEKCDECDQVTLECENKSEDTEEIIEMNTQVSQHDQENSDSDDGGGETVPMNDDQREQSLNREENLPDSSSVPVDQTTQELDSCSPPVEPMAQQPDSCSAPIDPMSQQPDSCPAPVAPMPRQPDSCPAPIEPMAQQGSCSAPVDPTLQPDDRSIDSETRDMATQNSSKTATESCQSKDESTSENTEKTNLIRSSSRH